MKSREEFDALNEADLKKQIIKPILRKMGFQGVNDYHGGAGELGKDVVCWKLDTLGHRENYAIVLKAIPINGQANIGKGTAGEVCMQVSQAFGSEYLDLVTSEPQSINQCWVVTNKSINKDAVGAIKASLSATRLDRLTRFINGDELWSLYMRYLGIEAIVPNLANLGKDLANIHPDYNINAKVSGTGVEISVVEKYPGAAAKHPLEIASNFSFPQTPEGLTKQKEFEDFIKKGTPVHIPSSYIQSVILPDFLQNLLGIFENQTPSISLSSPNDAPPIILSIEYLSSDEQPVEFKNIIFKPIAIGTEEETYVSELMSLPIVFRITFNILKHLILVNFKTEQREWNAAQLYDYSRLLSCISKPFKIRILHAETRNVILEQAYSQGIVEVPDPKYLTIVDVLARFQKKINQQIIIPDRSFTSEEIKTILRLKEILEKGEVRVHWSYLNTMLLPESIPDLITVFGDGKTGDILLEFDEELELFNVNIPMGRVRIRGNATLTNMKEMMDLYGQNPTAIDPFEGRFIVADEGATIQEYLDWKSPIDQ